MKLYRLHSEVVVNEILEEVYGFFSDASNLQQITPPWLNFEVISRMPIEMKTGQTIDYRLKIRGFPVGWRSEITQWDPPHQFVDEQVRGPYRVWRHRHVFAARGDKTVCQDDVTYAVPGGRLVNRWLVEPDVKRIFAYRRKRLLDLFGGA